MTLFGSSGIGAPNPPLRQAAGRYVTFALVQLNTYGYFFLILYAMQIIYLFSWEDDSMLERFVVLFAIIIILWIIGFAMLISRGMKNKARPYAQTRPSNFADWLEPTEGLTRVFDNSDFGGGEDALISGINQWLADNPQFGNIQCNFKIGSKIGILVNSFALNSVTFSYNILKGVNTYQYAITKIEHTGLYRKDPEDMLEEWKYQNPNAILLRTQSGWNMRGQGGSFYPGGIGGTNLTQVYVFFKFLSNRDVMIIG